MRGRGAALLIGMKAGQAKGAQQAQAQQQQQQAPAPAAPAPAAAPDMTAELQKLAQLHQSGVLSDQEFAAAKQKLLS